MDNSTDITADRLNEEHFTSETSEDPFLIFFNNQLLSDVTFVVGADRKRIPGHKIILSRSSYEFFNVFNNIRLDKDELLIEDVTEEIFLSFLKFCYIGKVELDGIDGLAVLKLAYRFQVKSLIEKCETYLCEVVDEGNCLEFYAKSSFLKQDSKLKDRILGQIETSFVWLTWEKDHILYNLPLEALREIVDLENFECDEMLIFDGIINWAKHNCEKNNISCQPKNLRRILRDVFYKIRFPTMKSDWFIEIISKYPNLLTMEEIIDISRVIQSDQKSSSKFTHKLRKNGSAYVRNPLTFNWETIGNPVECFPGSFELRNDSSSEMSLRFRTENSRVLLGFGFIGKRNQTKKIISCKLELDDASASNPDTEIKLQWILSWDYCVTVAFFKKKYVLERLKYRWYNLYCKIACDMVNVKLDPPYTTNELISKGIHIKKGDHNIIPYLIFE